MKQLTILLKKSLLNSTLDNNQFLILNNKIQIDRTHNTIIILKRLKINLIEF
jgi:hypothetical protein